MARHCYVVNCSRGDYQLKRHWKGVKCDIHGVFHGDEPCDCDPPFRLFSFPGKVRNPEARKMWLKSINRADPKKPHTWLDPSKDQVVCSRHFREGFPSEQYPYPELHMGVYTRANEAATNQRKRHCIERERQREETMEGVDSESDQYLPVPSQSPDESEGPQSENEIAAKASFESDVVGILVGCDESILDISLKTMEGVDSESDQYLPVPSQSPDESEGPQSENEIAAKASFESDVVGILVGCDESILDISLKTMEGVDSESDPYLPVPSQSPDESEGPQSENEIAAKASFESDVVGILVGCDESILDISLKLHDYGKFRPTPSRFRHLSEKTQPEMVSTSTQTDETRIPQTKSTQTPVVQTTSSGSQARRPTFTFDDVAHSDSKLLFFTGIPNSGTFKCLFDELEGGMTSGKKTGRPNSLRLVDEFFMVLMRLRLGLLLEDLAERFNVSVGTCSTVFNLWINYMDLSLSFQVKWPSHKNIIDTMPRIFKEKYPKCRVIIDCTEIRTETPCSSPLKSLLYGDYKSHMTWKSLIGISPAGIVTFVSDLYPGSISDKQITKKSGLVDMCEKGDAIMADKGFSISDLTTPRGVELIIPPFKKKKTQFLPHEVEATKNIANLRIHVEREMERIKNFRIVQGTMPITMSAQATKIWKICVSMTNLLPPLVLNR